VGYFYHPMRILRPLVIVVSFALSLSAKSASNRDSLDIRKSATVEHAKLQAASLAKYAKEHNYNSHYCFLIDMSLPSGKKRLFVYNLDKDSIEYSLLVAHGYGSSKPGSDELEFSNTINSGMTSLGKYSIGKSYYGNFGLSYKLHGLDSTNSNAYARTIVLHSFSQMPDIEVYPQRSALSAGCPMVSPYSFAVLNKYITNSSKPILLWIYN